MLVIRNVVAISKRKIASRAPVRRTETISLIPAIRKRVKKTFSSRKATGAQIDGPYTRTQNIDLSRSKTYQICRVRQPPRIWKRMFPTIQTRSKNFRNVKIREPIWYVTQLGNIMTIGWNTLKKVSFMRDRPPIWTSLRVVSLMKIFLVIDASIVHVHLYRCNCDSFKFVVNKSNYIIYFISQFI